MEAEIEKPRRKPSPVPEASSQAPATAAPEPPKRSAAPPPFLLDFFPLE